MCKTGSFSALFKLGLELRLHYPQEATAKVHDVRPQEKRSNQTEPLLLGADQDMAAAPPLIVGGGFRGWLLAVGKEAIFMQRWAQKGQKRYGPNGKRRY